MFSPDLMDKYVTFAAAAAAGHFFFWSRLTFAVISDSRRYFEISFSVRGVLRACMLPSYSRHFP